MTYREIQFPYLESIPINSGILSCKLVYHQLFAPKYPPQRIILWLHGSSPNPNAMFLLTARTYLRQLLSFYMTTNPFILIMPICKADMLWTNSVSGTYRIEDFLIHELLPNLWSSFPYLKNKKVEIHGYSMGGYGALRLAFKHPSLFSNPIVFGAGPLSTYFDDISLGDGAIAKSIYHSIFSGSQEVFRRFSPYALALSSLDTVLANGLHVELFIGSQDRAITSNKEFASRLRRIGMNINLTILEATDHSLSSYYNSLTNPFLGT